MPKGPEKRSFVSTAAGIPLRAIACSLAIVGVLLRAQDKSLTATPDANAARRIEARSAFESVCASCHGLDAGGGERGPNIASRPEVVRKTDAELVKILMDGKVAEGMPSFASYGPAKLSALVAYLRTLQGRIRGVPLPGDPSRGKVLFFGKAKCAECHMVGGQGGFFARDLTAYAAGMDANKVRTAIVNPNKGLDPRRGVVTVVLDDSTVVSGVARNEDNFSLQLQTPDGVFHLLNKSDIRTVTFTGKSPMPSAYGSTLSPAELNDLVSYLLRTSEKGRKVESKAEDGDEE
jgi:cytochrome c oxidase cbb3-type subunit 3